MHPAMIFFLGWLVGSFFGLSAVLGFAKGLGGKTAH